MENRALDSRRYWRLALLLLAALVCNACSRLDIESTTSAPQEKNLPLISVTHAEKRFVAVGEYGRILLSDDSGKSWIVAQTPTRALLTAVCFPDAMHGWAVGHDKVILHSVDGGLSWSQQYAVAQENRPLLDVKFRDALHGYAVGAYGAFLATTDGGKTWVSRPHTQDDRHLNSLSILSDGTLLLAGESGLLRRSFDTGLSWKTITTPYGGSFFGALQTRQSTLLLFGLRGTILRSEDNGASWQGVSNSSHAGLMSGALLPDGRVVLAGAGGTLLESRDDGRSFQSLRSGRTQSFAGVADGADGNLLLVGEEGVTLIQAGLH